MQRTNTFNLPNYSSETDLCLKLLNYTDSNHSKPYIDQLQKIANRTSEQLDVRLDDVSKIIDKDFAERIEKNVLRYISLLYIAADKLMPKAGSSVAVVTRDDVFLSSRLRMIGLDSELINNEKKQLPPDLTRRYEIIIHPFSSAKVHSVREVKSDLIGKLIVVSGMTTRITNVRPLLFVATYTCDACGHEFYKSIRSKEFMPMILCENPNCVSSEKIHLQTRGSRFLKYQQLTIQETPDTIPFGGIPRTMTINLRSSSVRKCVSGDTVTISGVFLPITYTGFKQMRAGLTSNTAFEGMHIEKQKANYREKEISAEELEKIREVASDSEVYEKLARSIAPEIFGLLDVKKALLLMMIGGATKRLSDGICIRGDINVLLMGDPGVAKSQLLKHISVIAPRAVYTTGKGSSGVGLTAAVIRDPVTEELVLEGGALVMADMGICCIDEFDKMEEGDRTAIHEVMEQQTVSISKAGICTTLNARTSVLAAANPAYGRYDKSKPPEANILLPAALMSRFDLMFVLVDSPSLAEDSELASHICFVHKHKKAPDFAFDAFSAEFLRSYISVARKTEPIVPADIVENIVEVYIRMRSEGRESDAKRLLPTPRTLLSILRISQALARVKLKDKISQEDISEATRLMHSSRASMDGGKDEEKTHQDSTTAIYSFIKDKMQTSGQVSAKLSDLIDALKMRGHSLPKINEAIDHYAGLDVWIVNKSRTKLSLL